MTTWVLEISIKKKTSILISGQYFTVWVLIQTSFQVINGKIFFAIIHKSRIKHPFTSIIKESIRYCQNEFQFKIKNLGLKIYIKKTCYWCMKILDYWLNKSHKHVKTKIESKTKPKTNTQDNVLRMNMKNILQQKSKNA